MKTRVLAKFMNATVWIFLVLLMITLLTLPYLVNHYVQLAGVRLMHALTLKIFLYVTAIPFLMLLISAKKLCNNLLKGNPFCESSVSALKIISLCAFIDFVLYLAATFTIFGNLLSLTLTVAAFMVGLAGLILSQVVQMALEIKKENDLTI